MQAGLGSNLLSLGALSIEQAPPEAVLALGGVALLALGGIAYAAIQAQSGDTAGAEPAAPPPPLRENAVLVFGATGRMGRVLVDSVRRDQAVECGPALESSSQCSLMRGCHQARPRAPYSAHIKNPLLCTLRPLLLLPAQLLAQGRTVIAATRSADCARDVLGKVG